MKPTVTIQTRETLETLIREEVQNKNVEFLLMQFVDVLGNLKHLELPVSQLDRVMKNGLMFDGSSILGFTSIENSDMFLKADLETFITLPWEDHKVARFICDIYDPNGNPFSGDPRAVLKRSLKKAEKMGFNGLNVGPEPEFFLFPLDEKGEPQFVAHDSVAYADMHAKDVGQKVRQEITRTLNAMGYEVEMLHHEVANGQHEVDFKYGDALTTADRIVTFKWVVKEVASKFGFHASFLPKPIARVNGSGMHMNQSLFTMEGNAFYDVNDEIGLSSNARHYIAGILEHARSFAAITNPLVNSYKRLVPGYEAPCYIAWSCSNRSALIRIPASRGAGTRVEVRCPDPSSNPYLATAVMLTAGLDGIERKIELRPEVKENIYHMDASSRKEKGIDALPSDLKEALDLLSADQIIVDTLGEHLYDAYTELKQAEWNEYRLEVHAWELEKYGNI